MVMTEMSLQTAVGAFVVMSAAGAVVSAREDLRGEVLGWQPPGPVGRNLALGIGSGTSPPWPMVAAALAAAIRAHQRPDRVWPGRTCVAIGCGVIAGVLIEPVTWGRCGSRAARTLNRLGLPIGLELVRAGRRSIHGAQDSAALSPSHSAALSPPHAV